MGWIRAFTLAFVAIVVADAVAGSLGLPTAIDALFAGIAVAVAYRIAERLGWIGWARRSRAPLDPEKPARND